MEKTEPENTIRSVVDACADCDVCRHLMDTSCLLFPELYRLYDRETESGEEITPEELRHLVDRCNFCALCPCPNIRADIIRAKTEFIARDGLNFGVRTLEDVERIGRLCGVHPGLANRFFRRRWPSGALKKVMGIHQERIIPEFPKKNFPKWAKKQKLNIKPNPGQKRKVAYFAGCTARHLFPQVPKAAVEVFQRNGIAVHYLDQQCCGMPTLLEGDRPLTLRFVQFNVDRLVEAVEDGYAIVCSCPTCGYMLKSVLKEGAYYSAEYQESIGADRKSFKLPSDRRAGQIGFVTLQKSIYGNIVKDDGYFSSISPRKRILVAENPFDVGEYLAELHRAGRLNSDFGPVSARIAYYPPCHLREQESVGRIRI